MRFSLQEQFRINYKRWEQNLLPSSQSKNQVKSRFLLDVVIAQSAAILQLFASKDQTLLVWRNSLFVLDLSLHVFNGVRRFDFKSDGLACQCLHEDLHASSQSQDKVEGGLLLDIVVAQSSTVLQLFTGKDQTLLVWRNSFLILDLSLHVLDRIRRLHLKSDGFASKSFDKYLHASPQPQDQMKRRLFLDVVIAQCSTILQLLSGKNKTLLIRGNSFLVLNLCFYVLDRVRRLNFKSNGFSGEGLDENLHSSSQSKHQVKS